MGDDRGKERGKTQEVAIVPYGDGWMVAIRGAGDRPLSRPLAERIARGATREFKRLGFPVLAEPDDLRDWKETA